MNTPSDWQILLIDDEPDSLNLLHEMLALNGVTVRHAPNGTEGLALLETFVPSLVLVDLSMPKPDGWDVLSAIRAKSATAAVPVVAISAYATDNVIERARQAGFSTLIAKPIKLGKLLSTLRDILATQPDAASRSLIYWRVALPSRFCTICCAISRI